MPNPAIVISINVDTASANANVLKFNRGLSDIETTARKATGGASSGMSSLERSVATASVTIKNHLLSVREAMFAVFGAGFIEASKSALRVAASFELAEVGIAAFVKEGENAQKVFGELKEFALKSPLEFTTILESANQLLALDTAAKDLIPTLEGLSTAVFAVTGGKDVPDKLKDVIRALGQIRAAGVLTGEEFRQLRNASVVTLDELAAAFGVTADKFRKAISDRAVPAGAVIQATLQAVEDRFSKFRGKVEGTATVAFSNFTDALGQAADAAIRDYIPSIVNGINSLSKTVRDLAEGIRRYRPEIEYGFKVIGSTLLVAGVYKMVTALAELRFGWVALNGAIASNPIGAALVGVTLGIAAFENLGDYIDSSRIAAIKLNLEAQQTTRVLAGIKQGKSNEDFLKLGFSAEQLAKSYKSLNDQGYRLQKRLEELPAAAKKFAEESRPKRKQFELDYSLKQAEEAENRRREAVKNSETYLEASRRKEVQGLQLVREAYEQKLRDVRGFKEAEKNVEVGFTNFLRAERDKQFKDIQKDVDRALTEYEKLNNQRKQQLLQYTDETREILERAAVDALNGQVAVAERTRDSQLRTLALITDETVESRLYAAQEAARIDIEFQRASLAAREAAAEAQFKADVDRAKRQSFDTLAIELEKIQRVNEEHLAALELRARTQALFEAKGGALSQEQEIALQKQLAAIRVTFAEFTAQQEAGIRESTAVHLNSRLAALAVEHEQNVKKLREETAGEIVAAQETVLVRSAEVVRDNNLRIFQGLKRNVEGLFDSIVTRSKSFWQSIADSFKLPILAAIKEIVSSRVAAMLFQLFGGGPVTVRNGQPSFGGVIGATAGGGSNILGRLLGLGGAAALGGGGVSFPGAPGGTPGFAGPVGVGASSSGGVGGAGGVAGSLAGSAASLKGILTSIGNIGRSSVVTGPGSTGGAFASKGVGGAAGGALLLGGAALAYDGLRRGGALGLAETTAGGALIGFKFGGPLGAVIGASIGAVAGTIRLFIKGAQEKIVEKVKSVYGVTISKNFARDPLFGIIKQTFGGNIDVGIRSPQIRDLIELYAMSTGQNSAGINTSRPIGANFALGGSGALTQQPVFQNGLSLGVGRASNAAPAAVVVQLDPQATEAFLQGQAIQAMSTNPRAVQGAVAVASRQNAGRREGLALAVNPMLLTR